MHKTCSKCKEFKPYTEFYKLHTTRDGRNPRCKKCMQEYQSSLYFNNEEYRNKRKKLATRCSRKRKYGVSEIQFNDILKSQNYCCKICNILLDESRFGLKGQLDHCHTTGLVRGILCSSCNTALGGFKDSEDLLLNAIQYLRGNK